MKPVVVMIDTVWNRDPRTIPSLRRSPALNRLSVMRSAAPRVTSAYRRNSGFLKCSFTPG